MWCLRASIDWWITIWISTTISIVIHHFVWSFCGFVYGSQKDFRDASELFSFRVSCLFDIKQTLKKKQLLKNNIIILVAHTQKKLC